MRDGTIALHVYVNLIQLLPCYLLSRVFALVPVVPPVSVPILPKLAQSGGPILPNLAAQLPNLVRPIWCQLRRLLIGAASIAGPENCKSNRPIGLVGAADWCQG